MNHQGKKRLYGALLALLLVALLLTAVLWFWDRGRFSWDRGRFSVPPTSGWDGEPSPVPPRGRDDKRHAEYAARG